MSGTRSTDTVNELERAVARTLRRYLPESIGESVRRRAQTAIGVAQGALEPSDLPALATALRQGVRLFADPALQPALLRELQSLAAPVGRPDAERHPIRQEKDVSIVRVRARELAMELGGSALGAQRAATATSELARNIVSYAGDGWVELVPSSGAPSMTIRAADVGPGIRDVALVLSGKYRSRTGLGRGLAGVKRLATRFEIATGTGGTRIEAEIAL
jgi:serine/threonine-protein kinase RsbT